ncbi:MAG: AAA family ATPase [Candidatus Symbiothrix sp.]|jgi:AAA+ ATPase superfamily predicted ATPase|nr:AAA family ATPase [Candidatus Symbiothrix sp.]
MAIIGRKAEQEDLKRLVQSDKAEFVAVFGRRRVGKTFLVREFFGSKFTFYHTGMANERLESQLHSFNASLNEYGTEKYEEQKSWFDSFGQLKHLLQNTKKRGKKVVFIDEMPWMDTPRSGFLSALEHFWNAWASGQKDILLIVCGSASSWITNKLLNNHGGLHNRITGQIQLRPFTLLECEQFYRRQRIAMSQHEIVENYMIFGGIPFYLSLMRKELSMTQNVDNLLFTENAPLKNEFKNLYASLFKKAENHIKIVEALSNKRKGLTREEIIEATKLPNGGSINRIFDELELCGFIRRYRNYGKKTRDTLFQLIDFYTLFYFNFLKDRSILDEHYWSHFIENARHRAWSGYAFEQVCLAHLPQIKQTLGISGVLTSAYSWRSNDSENGAQIDLVIDRNDRVINLCEIKFASGKFIIDKKQDENLRNKRTVFREETQTNKALHLTMITTYGIRRNKFSGNIQSQITVNDLFK